jgi:DNA (cytosine-5)-methyltransferase 1
MTDDPPTFGSLFAGIGGIDLGLERAGWRCAWQVENDPYCTRVLAKHWPDVPRFGDVKEINGRDLPPVDLVAGGFPCQPVSIAGLRRGQLDERWLWPDFARIIRDVGPRFVFVENVPGILVRGMGDVLGELAACGYDAEWDCIPAAAFGAPHLRYRVCIVAHAEGEPIGPGLRQSRAPGIGERRSAHGGGTADPVAVAAEFGLQTCDNMAGAIPATGEAGMDGRGWWGTEPAVGRVAYGVPARVDRLRGLGNAVVPQMAEWIGRRILAAA